MVSFVALHFWTSIKIIHIPLPGICGSPRWKGDTYCDDENNNEGCDWDGGDCCGANVKKFFCTECECKDPSAGGNDGGNTDCSKYL